MALTFAKFAKFVTLDLTLKHATINTSNLNMLTLINLQELSSMTYGINMMIIHMRNLNQNTPIFTKSMIDICKKSTRTIGRNVIGDTVFEDGILDFFTLSELTV